MRLPQAYGPSLAVLAAAATVLLLGPAVVRELGYRHDQSRSQLASERLAGPGILEELNQAFRDLAVAVEPSVVHVATRQMRPGRGGSTSLSTGSGWIYDDRGYVVTNHHVVTNSVDIEVQLSSGALRRADLVGSDPLTDIAVLRIDDDRIIPAVRRPISDPVEQGDLVFAFGSPFDFRFSMSQGVVSGKDRYAGVLVSRARPGYENFIQVDAAINPGNSGGPLTDFRGRVIGMNTAIATTGQRSVGDEGRFAGIGLAIPLEMIEPVVDQIIERGFALHGFLGVSLRDLQPVDRAALGWDAAGIRVMNVTAGTAADDAGLMPGDVITELNGDAVDNVRSFIARVGSTPPGTGIELAVRRPRDDGELESKAFEVTLGRRDTLAIDGRLPADQSRAAIPQLGIEAMETATPERCARLGIPFHPGVIVTAWVEGTRFSRGVPGDESGPATPENTIIVETNGLPVTDVDSLIAALGTALIGPDHQGSPTGLVLPDGRRGNVWLRDLRSP